MQSYVLRNVAILPGGDALFIPNADVFVENGIIADVRERPGSSGRLLMPALVDLHLDVLSARLRPRANVQLGLEETIVALDAEVAASGIGTVCIAARFEESPARGVRTADATMLCAAVERLHRSLLATWLIHARVEVTDEAAVEAFEDALAVSNRIALVSVMDHSAEHSRFGSPEAHRAYYAQDWSLPLSEVDEILARKRAGLQGASERRRRVAGLANQCKLPLASHDDRTPEEVGEARELGASIAEFPLSVEAAQTAAALGMSVVLGAPNAVRDRSTSPGNLTVTSALRAGLRPILCSDYLPQALLSAPFLLAERGLLDLSEAVRLVTDAPARAVGLACPRIEVGAPLNGTLVATIGPARIAAALWRDGRMLYGRSVVDSDVATSL